MKETEEKKKKISVNTVMLLGQDNDRRGRDSIVMQSGQMCVCFSGKL